VKRNLIPSSSLNEFCYYKSWVSSDDEVILKIDYTGQQNLTFLAHEGKYPILIEHLTLNSNV
jgi:hypothetical protein